MKKGCGNSMRPCKKCKIFLAMPGKDYCSSCYSPKLDITPCPTGIDIPQKSQNITTSNHLVEQYQSEGGNSIQQQSIETVNVSPREGPPPEKEINEKVNKLTILLASPLIDIWFCPVITMIIMFIVPGHSRVHNRETIIESFSLLLVSITFHHNPP